MDKRGATVIGGYSDYYCRGIFYSNVSFWFHFYCFVDSVVFFISSETSLHLVAYLQCQTDALQGAYVIHMERFWRLFLCFGAILIALLIS